MGRVIEPRKINIVGVDAVIAAEDINRCTEWSGAQAEERGTCAEGCPGTWEILFAP